MPTSNIRSLCTHTLALFVVVAACSSSDEGNSNGSSTADGAGGYGAPGAGGGANPGTAGGPAPGPGCGNGRIDPGEECDPSITSTCAAVTLGARPNGALTCVACRFDTSACTGAGSGGAANGTGGAPDNTGGMMGEAGSPASSGGTPAGSGGTPAGSGGTPSADGLDALRQVCADTINEYRQTLGLPPLSRGSAAQETCSDQGAERDSSGPVHGSAGDCPGLGSQNTCPGWNPTWYGGEEGALRACLQMMWAEGEPPVPRNQCTGQCFQTYGHYLNMSSPTAAVVSCGFYRMANGEIWMNQDFGR